MDITLLTGEDASKIDPEQIAWAPDSIVAVATNGDKTIKGRSAIVNLPHIEGTWVAESERGSTLGYRLVKTVEDVMKNAKKTHAFAFVKIDQPEVLGYMLRMGYKPVPYIVLNKEL